MRRATVSVVHTEITSAARHAAPCSNTIKPAQFSTSPAWLASKRRSTCWTTCVKRGFGTSTFLPRGPALFQEEHKACWREEGALRTAGGARCR